MEITAYLEDRYRCRVPVRQFTVMVDEPPEVGGTDGGPMPTELLLASLTACFAMALSHAAGKRGIELGDVSVTARAEYAGLGLSRIQLDVRTDRPEEVRRLLDPAIRTCYVSNTLKMSPEIDYRVLDRVTHPPSPPPG